MGVAVRISLFQPAGDRVGFGLRLRFSDAWFEPRNQVKKMRATLNRYWLFSRRIVGNRSPEIERLVLDRKLKAVRHHTDDRVALTVKRYRPIQKTQIGIETTGK